MSCGESSYNYVNRQIKKISEKQHNFIRLQDRVNANIFNKLDEINHKLLNIELGNNDEIKKEIEKLATQINEVKDIISQNTKENSIKFNDINNSILVLQNKDKSHDAEILSIKEKNSTQDTEIASIKEKNSTQDTEIASIKEKNSTQDTEIASIKEKNSTQDEHINTLDTRLQSNTTEITNLITKTDNTNTKLETYKTNTSNEIDNINNTLNSVEVKTLTVNTATFANVQQFVFQKKIVNIVGIFRTAHYQSGYSQLIQIKDPYPARLAHFVACDRETNKVMEAFVTPGGIIQFSLPYSGEKVIFFNVSYIA